MMKICFFDGPDPNVFNPIDGRPAEDTRDFLSISDLADRWRCSRGTVYNRLRACGAKVLDFAPPGRKGKKAVPMTTVIEIEDRKMKQIH